MAGIGNLFGGFAKGYYLAKQAKEERDDRKKELDAKLKLYEIQLKREQATAEATAQQQAARKQIFTDLGGSVPITSTPQDGVGPIPGPRPPMSLTDYLADPKHAMTVLQAGFGDLKDITGLQNQGENQELLKRLLGGGGIDESGAAGGVPMGPATGRGASPFEVSGIKLDSSGNPMIDLSRRGEVARWMISPDGKTQIGVDKMGRAVMTMSAGPGDRAEEDKPLTPAELLNFRDQNGNPPPPGTTLRNAQQLGFRPISSAAQGVEVSIKSTGAILDRLDQLSKDVFTAEPGVGRFAQGLKFAGQRLTQTNEPLDLYESFSTGTVAPIIRALGDKGNLSQGDVDRAIALLPKTKPVPDTSALAKAKLAQLRSVLSAAISGDKDKASALLENADKQFGAKGGASGGASQTLTYDPATGTFK